MKIDQNLKSSNEPVKNGCEVIYEMFHILNCGLEIKKKRVGFSPSSSHRALQRNKTPVSSLEINSLSRFSSSQISGDIEKSPATSELFNLMISLVKTTRSCESLIRSVI